MLHRVAHRRRLLDPRLTSCVLMSVATCGLLGCAMPTNDTNTNEQATSEAEEADLTRSAQTPQPANDQLTTDGLPDSPAVVKLRERAAAQIMQATTPQFVAPAWLPPSTHLDPDELERAQQPLAEVLEPIRSQPLFRQPNIPTVSPSAEDLDRALRLYTRGRLAAGQGEISQAMTDLEAAAKLDPTSAQIMHELAKAQMAGGLRNLGLRSHQRAAELGFDHVRVWAMIGLEAIRRRDLENGQRWLVAAYDGLKDGADPIAVSWIELSLGELLLGDNQHRSGASLIRSAITRPIAESSQSSFRDEYATLIRRTPQLWLRVGDAEALIGDWAGASSAYELAQSGATGEIADSIALRRLAVLSASGRTAEASLALLKQLQAGGYVPDDALRTLLRLGEREPSLADAIGEIRLTLPAAHPSIKSRLLTAELAARWREPSINDFSSALPVRAEHLVYWLRLVDRDEVRWTLVRALAKQHPASVHEIAAALVQGGLIAGPNLADWTTDESTLSLAVRLALGMPNRELELTESGHSPERVAVLIESAVRLGRWDSVKSLLTGVEPIGDAAHFQVLAAASMPSLALDVWKRSVRADADLDQQLLAADLAMNLRDPNHAGQILLNAWRDDPCDERIYHRMIEVVTHPALTAMKSELESALRTLRDHVPGSITLETLEVSEMIKRGFFAEAESRARSIVERTPTLKETDFAGLLTLWQGAAERGDTATLDAAAAWLDALHDDRRPIQAIGVTIAKVVAMRSGAIEGRQALNSIALVKTPRLVEVESSLLRQAERHDEAFTLADNLFRQPTLSVDDTLRHAQALLRHNQSIEAPLARLSDIPATFQLSRHDVPLVLDVCNGLMSVLSHSRAEQAVEQARSREYIAVVGFAIKHGAWIPELYHRVRMRLLAISPETTLDDLNLAAGQLHSAIGAISDDVFEDVFTTLIEQSRTQDALYWSVETILLDEDLNEMRFGSIVSPLASLGTVATVEVTMDRLESADKLLDAIAVLSPLAPGDERDNLNARAELSYILAGIAASRDRGSQAELLYELALRYQPEHPWTCNDYGYLLADRGDDLVKAEQLIEIAFEALPDQANVLDTVGWLRYKQGRFVEPDGTGAVGMLERTIEVAQADASPAMYDHLGDAYWMVGREDDAVLAWEKAEARYLQRVRDNNSPQMRGGPLYNSLQASLGQVRQKLRAAESPGIEPQVAATLGERIVEPNK